MRQICAGPPEQLTPITSAPLSAQRLRHPGGRIAQQGAVVAGEGHRGHHRQVADLAGGRDGFAQLVQVAEGLQDQQIRPGLGQGRDLLGEGLAGLLGLDAAERRQAHPQRADVAGHQHLPEGRHRHPARQLHPGPVDLGDLVLQAVRGQLVAVGAEGVGLDDLRPGLDVRAVDLRHQRRAGSG